MKIKALSRSEEQYTRECKGDVMKVFRNTDASIHPFDKAREYTRALQATKLDRVFARPFVGEYHDGPPLSDQGPRLQQPGYSGSFVVMLL